MDIKGGKKMSADALVALIQTTPVSFYTSVSSKIKLILFSAGFVFFGALCLWLGLQDSDFGLIGVGLLLGLLGLVFGGLLLKKFSNNQPNIQITKDGLYDHHSLKGAFIAWDEIKKITLYKQGNQLFLGLYLFDADSKRPNQRSLTKASNQLGNSLGLPDFIYPQSLLGGQKVETIAEVLEQLHLKYSNPFKENA